ncbi:4Fe-4S dicluster domain-containing protein [Myxococcota bacterium]|nr:4Fe-4S dicluster domain-containing protein [Myxococcota bacterium]
MGSSRLRVLGSIPRSADIPEHWTGIRDLVARDSGPTSEFPEGADGPPSIDRRRFLARVGASLGLAGLAMGCDTRRAERIIPYSRQPPEVTPGVPSHYATSFVRGGYAMGLVVATREGRPIKVEGSPEHPASLGATTAQAQASLLELYDRARHGVLREGAYPTSWDAFVRVFGAPLPNQIAVPGTAQANAPGALDDGSDLHFLMEPTTSPLVVDQIRRIREKLPRAEFHFWDPLAGIGAIEASRALFGRVLVPVHDLSKARIIVDVDADALNEHPLSLRYGRQFADGRRLAGGAREMNRLYVIESGLSTTGVVADHRLPVMARRIAPIVAALVRAVATELGARAPLPPDVGAALDRMSAGLGEDVAPFVRALARDLVRAAGASVIIAGERQPANVHGLVAVLNELLGNRGRTITWVPSAIFEAGEPSHGISSLAGAIEAGQVGRLVILGGNPVYTAPADFDFGRLLRRVPRSAYLGMYDDETAAHATWFIPAAHYLEAWGDARAYDGTVSLVQPMIEPLHGGRTCAEILGMFLGERVGGRDLLSRFWTKRDPERVPGSLERQTNVGSPDVPGGPAGFSSVAPPEVSSSWLAERTIEDGLARALRDGMFAGSAFEAVDVAPRLDVIAGALASAGPPAPLGATELELSFQEDDRLGGGERTNNVWLLELPHPLTKETWGNAALVGPETARRFDLEDHQWVRLEYRGNSADTPVIILPGHPEGTVTVELGWGRRLGEDDAATGVGFDAYRLRTSAAPWFDGGLALRKIATPRGLEGQLAITQEHWRMEGRRLAESTSLAAYLRDPSLGHETEPPPTLRTGGTQAARQWGMAIDLGVCTGCSACVVACQSENNVLPVGKLDVEKGREMHWLRIDRYFTGPVEAPAIVMQPMLCQHCEHAPCEYVCPVNATVHSDDGLNDMVYNRCVGTRFCSNNCPYKVRRFNWFDYSDRLSVTEKMAMNPDVTVRARGVMEKCTFCVQRIRREGIDQRIEGRRYEDGDVVTACAQACPTNAIVFGDVRDPESRVSRLREDPRAYSVLHDQGTRPRVRYLTRVRNENPELTGAKPGAGEGT